ncbi:FtsW/RodA/SpoVE family cell cycle protein [Heyndrickxia vini]|uniref:FtsW/RodA/SpoVE family cell cycle protein n=1 Tax=Heyndrickxia vini TaxID=1476025 RepID=A0ABX7E3J0_9BACI|nr:FtsW/RodA/SpoVE family cell cycle protein [Heyndrickxia vini]QQZ09883.1 FtsW/RodA/SpoVE family cell cycle protein [Heyndrickxia vini]
MNDHKHSFLQEVTEQIKSKEAKKFIKLELDHHIQHAKNDWMQKGLTEDEAEEKAVVQMGSPQMLGQQFNKLHRPKIDWLLLILLGVTLLLGFMPLLSVAIKGYASNDPLLLKKAIFIVLGGVIAIGIMLGDYRRLKNLGLYFFSFGMGILFLLFFIGDVFNGVYVYHLGPVWVDSTVAMPFFIIAWASFLQNDHFNYWKICILFIFSVILFLPVGGIPSFFLYAIMVFIMLLWSGRDIKKTLIMAGAGIISVGIAGIVVFPSIKPYQLSRLTGFLQPESYPNSAGYIYLRMRELLADAGWTGHSVSNPKLFDFEPHTDLVFVSLTYHYGWIFGIGLMSVLLLFVGRMLGVLRKINDSFGKLLVFGAMILFTIQVVYNIGMSLGLLPITSMSLPFISYGFMPVVLNAIIIGIVLSVYRRKDLIISVM